MRFNILLEFFGSTHTTRFPNGINALKQARREVGFLLGVIWDCRPVWPGFRVT
jgi:hypothetical protein